MKINKVTSSAVIQGYRNHPRIIELRVVGIYNILVDEYGESQAKEIIMQLCDMFRLPFAMLWTVLSQSNRIRHQMGVTQERYTQEIIVMGELWGETRYTVARKFLKLKNHNYIYQDKLRHNFEYFGDTDWFDKLDDEVVVAGTPAVKNIIVGFLEAMENFLALF